MQVIECEQYSHAWWTARRGLPTASEFHNLITPKTGKPAAAAETYINRLIADTLSMEYPNKDEFESFAMKRGSRIEPQARKWLEFDQNIKTRLVGLCISDDGRFGCSPDALVGDDDGLELKCPLPATQVGWLREGILPPEHLAQVHGSMIVTGRRKWTWAAFCPGLPPLLIRVQRDEYTEKLERALEEFHAKYKSVLEEVKSM